MAAARLIAVLCNPLAGAGRSLRLSREIDEKLTVQRIDHIVFETEWPGALAGFTEVFVIGGDGTLNVFINKYRNIDLPITIFNGGTGNDFHWLLYGKISLDQQIDLALNIFPKRIDAGQCNERLFLNGVGIGFEGAVAGSLTGKKKRAGKTSFLIAILKKIFSYRSHIYKIVNAEDDAQVRRLLMVSVMNGRRAGGGFHVAPDSAADDGLLDAVFVAPLSPLQRLRYLPVIEKGRHLDLSFISMIRTNKIIIESDAPIDAHLDGEYFSSKKLEIRILTGKYLFCY